MKKEKNMKKTKKVLLIVGCVIGCIVLIMATLNIIPPKKVIADNPFMIEEGASPMIIAHRGGCALNPENTLKAHKASVYEYGATVLETDFYLTKDGKLVCSHDETITRMSDVEEVNPNGGTKVSDYTLEELKNFNFGHDFKDLEGNKPYHDFVSPDQADRREVLQANELQIIEASELFSTFYADKPDLLFVVEIKNAGEEGFKAADTLTAMVESQFPNYKNNIVIGTFHTEVEEYLEEQYPTFHRGASTGGATDFVVTQLLGVNLFNDSSFICLQLPMEQMNIDLTMKTFINRAHRRNIAVQYWTINDKDDMRDLIERGCDGIMTDNPKALQEVLAEYDFQ